MKKLIQSLFLLCITVSANAQVTLDSLNTKVNKLDKFMDVLREFRIQMYAQPQFQYFDSTNADPSYAGGGSTATSNNRFTLRRGRLKLSYDHEGKKGFRLFQATFQLDMTERGVQMRDFYGRIIDPWTGWIGIQAGFMDRPFGYEVATGDDTRETPERGRLSQTIFPAEKDLGAELVIESPKTFKPFYARLDGGLFNGTGAVSSFTKHKDFIGRLQIRKTFKINGSTNFTLSGGASYYNGAVLQSTPIVYSFQNDEFGSLRYTKITDSAAVNKKFYKREYYGFELQAGVDYKIGSTTFRGEFIAGKQPGLATSDVVPTALGSDLDLRRFNGAYFYLVQTFKHKIKEQTIYHDLVFKYDWYDPNTQIKGKDLSSANDSKVSRADVKFQTIGVGYIFRPCDFFKLMVYYDVVMNETTHIAGYTRDLRDNILTVRTQFAFDSNWFKKK